MKGKKNGGGGIQKESNGIITSRIEDHKGVRNGEWCRHPRASPSFVMGGRADVQCDTRVLEHDTIH